MYSEPNKPLTGVSKVTGAVALQGWCEWRNGSSLARSSFEHTLFSPLRNTRQAVGQDQSKSVSQLRLVLWPGYEEHLCPPQPPHCILIDTFPTCFYSKALSANTPNHTPLLGFQSPLKIPFTANPALYKVAGGLSWQSITEVRIQYFLEDCDHLFWFRPHRERACSVIINNTNKNSLQSHYLMPAIFATSINLSSTSS